MSTNISEKEFLEVISKYKQEDGKPIIYKVNQDVINDFPKVGVKRKYPFDNNQENQRSNVKKFRSN